MPAYEAQRGTDVWSDPEWLRQMASRHDALGVQARQRIQDMQQEAALGQQRDVHAENIRVREQGQRNTDRARADTLRENERVHRDAAAQRALDAQRLSDYRNATLGQQQENAQSRKDLGLLNLAQSPELMTAFGKQAPAIQKELLNRYFAAQQGGGAAGAGPTGGATLAALGGAAATDPGTDAVRNFHVAQGRATAPSPTTVAPSAAAAKAQAQPQGGYDFGPNPFNARLASPNTESVAALRQAQTDMPDTIAPPSGLTAREVMRMTPMGYVTKGMGTDASGNEVLTWQKDIPIQAGYGRSGGTGMTDTSPGVRGGLVYGGPPGYDFNTNTGDWIRSDVQGTINGLPAGEAIAQGALRTGISPESPSGIAALRTKQATIAGTGNPSLNEELASAGTFAPSTLAEKPPATNRPFIGSPELFSPSAAPVPGAPTTPPMVAGGTPPPKSSTISLGFGGHPIGEIPVGLSMSGRSNEAQDIAAGQPQAPVAGPPPVLNFSMNAPSNERQDVSALAASAPPPTVTSPTPPPEYSPPNPAHPSFHPANLVAEAHNKLYGLTPPLGQPQTAGGSKEFGPQQAAMLDEQQRKVEEALDQQRRRGL